MTARGMAASMPQPAAILAAMTGAEIVSGRLHHQLLAGGPTSSPATVVRTLGAVQGQDYLASLWAVAVRTPDATERDVEDAIARRELVRTWPMRGTLHLVAAEDARWMTELMAAKVIEADGRPLPPARPRPVGVRPLTGAFTRRCRATAR